MNRLVARSVSGSVSRSGAAAAAAAVPVSSFAGGRRALGVEPEAARQQRYQSEWDERTRQHREKTQQAAKDARFTAVRSLTKWGAVGFASVSVLLAMYLEHRRRQALPFELLGGATPETAHEVEPLFQTHVPAVRKAEDAKLSGLTPEERLKKRIENILQAVEDERQGVPAERKAVLLLNGMTKNRYASHTWEHEDPHAYVARPETVRDLKVATKGDGLKVLDDDYVYLHFAHPDQPNLVYREILKLDRDLPASSPLRDAIVGAASNSVLAFDYHSGSAETSGPRTVHVQSHADLLKEMVGDVDAANKRKMVLEGLRNRAF